jgi:hypothetical protein
MLYDKDLQYPNINLIVQRELAKPSSEQLIERIEEYDIADTKFVVSVRQEEIQRAAANLGGLSVSRIN